NTFADASQENVGRLHAHVRLIGRVFDKTLGGEEMRDKLAIAVHTHTEALSIPVPGEADGKEDHILQGIEFQGKGQQLIGEVQAAPVRAYLDGNLVDV